MAGMNWLGQCQRPDRGPGMDLAVCARHCFRAQAPGTTAGVPGVGKAVSRLSPSGAVSDRDLRLATLGQITGNENPDVPSRHQQIRILPALQKQAGGGCFPEYAAGVQFSGVAVLQDWQKCFRQLFRTGNLHPATQ